MATAGNKRKTLTRMQRQRFSRRIDAAKQENSFFWQKH
jgi:hypothetical protein